MKEESNAKRLSSNFKKRLIGISLYRKSRLWKSLDSTTSRKTLLETRVGKKINYKLLEVNE